MKLITALLLFVSIIANGQDVIDFKLLYDKKVPNTPNYSVADNTIDFRNIDHKGNYSVKLIGEYPKRLTVKNLIGGTIILEGGVTAATDNKTVQIADCKNVVIDLVNGKVTGNGLSTGVCGQLVYVYGKWNNVTLKGGRLHQNGKSGGAAFQVESYSDPAFSHGTLIVDGLIVTSAMGEGMYIGYNQPTKAYLDTLIIRNTNISNTRRDFWQLANVRWTLIENNTGTNGGLEKNLDHVSGLSLNGKNDKVIIRNNVISRIPQFVYSATRSDIELTNNIYDQGDAIPGNQIAYLKSNSKFVANKISAPLTKAVIFTADGCSITYSGDTINSAGKPIYRTFNGGRVTEIPFVVKTDETITVISSTFAGMTTKKYFLPTGEELILKP
jgi:hypothetical protein